MSGTHIRDWDVVASRVADALQEKGFLPNPSAPPAPNVEVQPIYVHAQGYGSTFLHSAKQSLEADILRRGGIVARGPAQAVIVNLEVDVVRWSPRPPWQDGTFTALGLAAGAGVMIADHSVAAGGIGLTALQGALALGALGLAADLVRASSPAQFGSEAAWQASIYVSDRLAFRLRQPMYIRTNDAPLYVAHSNLAPINTGGNVSLPVRAVRYDNR